MVATLDRTGVYLEQLQNKQNKTARYIVIVAILESGRMDDAWSFSKTGTGKAGGACGSGTTP